MHFFVELPVMGDVDGNELPVKAAKCSDASSR